jgi:hypothetical protein
VEVASAAPFFGPDSGATELARTVIIILALSSGIKDKMRIRLKINPRLLLDKPYEIALY